MSCIAIPDSASRRARLSRHIVLVIILVLTTFLITTLRGPAAMAETSPIGGTYPAAILLEQSGKPGSRTTPVQAHVCYGTGSGYAPQISTGFAQAQTSPYYNASVQTIWYRVWVQRWNGSTWAYYNGGRAWQKRVLPAYSTYGASFYGENVPVATGSWYRVAEEFVYEVNGTQVGRTVNVFNEFAYLRQGTVLLTTVHGQSGTCGIA